MKKLAAALMLGALAIAPAVAQDKVVEFKVSLWSPPAHPLVPSTKEWTDSMTKASGGTLKFSIFPSEQLGKAFDHYDMVRDGIADIVYVSPGYSVGRFPIFDATALPFLFGNATKGSLALDEWYRKLQAKEMGDTKFCFAFMHAPGSFHSRKKIVVPGDIKGMKIRPAQSMIGNMISLLGGTNVRASAPEAREALERGVADAIAFPWGSMFLFGIEKTVQYHMEEPLYVTAFTYNINPAKYNSLSAAQKKVIDDHCTGEWAAKIAAPWDKFETDGIDKMRALPNHELYRLTPAQKAEWEKIAEPLRKQWAEAASKKGVNAEEAYKELVALIARHGAQ